MKGTMLCVSFAATALIAGCGGGASNSAPTGGAPSSSGGRPSSSGGSSVSGGTLASGGATGAGGGQAGGSKSETGGNAAGGSIPSGGQTTVGGTIGVGGSMAASGGAAGSPTGGSKATGGSVSGGGGASSTGGTPGGVDGGTPGLAVPSTGCGKNRTLKDGNQTITTGGQNRTYYLKTPSNYDNTHPYRVVFQFHWNYGSINSIVNPPDADHNTDRPFYGMADLSGDTTIFVVPQGVISSTGGAGWPNTNNADVIFTDDMLAAISADLCIDTTRVFTTGFSFGGAISYKLACVRSDKFRAAIVYDTGPVSGNNASECTKPIAFFQSHGTDDQTFNYTSIGLPILNTFTKLNGCTALTPPTPSSNGHTCTSLEGCSAGHPIRFCNFGAGEDNPYNPSLKGHYPSAKDPGQPTSWVPAEAWKFIAQF